MQRGKLHIGFQDKPFVIKKGQRFQMVADLGEGECRIRIEKRVFELGSCPWMEGFADNQMDIFRVIPTRRRR